MQLQSDPAPKRQPQITLSNVISGCYLDWEKGWISKKIELTEDQKSAFVHVFGKGCTERRKEHLRRFINNLEGERTYGIYDRIVFGDYGIPCQYVAGQDYPSEVAYIRKLICGW